MKTKVIAFLLILCLACSLTACKLKSSESSTTTQQGNTEAPVDNPSEADTTDESELLNEEPDIILPSKDDKSEPKGPSKEPETIEMDEGESGSL